MLATNQPLVIDNGTGIIKAGFGGEDQPKSIFSNIVGRPKHVRAMASAIQGNYFIGSKAQELRGLLSLKYPMEHGIVQNWEDMERIWQYIFTEELKTSSELHPVLLTEAPLNPRKNRELAAELLFETMNVPAIYVSVQAVLSLYASGRTTGVVLDVGDGVSHSVPVVEGFTIPHAIKRMDLAGRDVTEHLELLLIKEGNSFTTSAEFEIIRQIKEKLCFVSQNPMKEEKNLSAKRETYILPDGRSIKLGTERFRASEILFSPHLVGHESHGVHQLVLDTINRVDLDLRRELYSNIVLAGGGTLLKGFGDRLLKETKKAVYKDMKVKIYAPPERKYSTWIGGSILSSLATFKKMWVTLDEYREDPDKKNSPPISKKAKKQAFNSDIPEYYFENGLRKVSPYNFVYQTYCKKRWIGMTLFSIYEKEFNDKSPKFYANAIKNGSITVNGQKCGLDYICQNNDLIENKIHRHEPPVCDSEIEIVFEDDEVLVVSKPSSIPVHPTGRYRHNSLVNILHFENGYGELHCVNRIDRLTSGLVLMAKNKIKAAELMEQMRNREISKVYYARVRGKFPYDEYECSEPLKTVSHKVGVNIVSKDGKPSVTKFNLISFNGTTSLLKCYPKTGRTHQIRVHLQYLGYPIANDPVYSCSEWADGNYVPNSDLESTREIVDKVTEKIFSKELPFDDSFTGCLECAESREDPIPEQLVIWLHAFSYTGEGWNYSTSNPSWANQDWNGDCDIEGRFWNYGGLWDGKSPGEFLK